MERRTTDNVVSMRPGKKRRDNNNNPSVRNICVMRTQPIGG